MKTGNEYWEEIWDMHNNLIADIIDTVPPKVRIEFDDLYLGHYDPEYMGYPQVVAVEHNMDGFVVITECPDDRIGLSDYTVEELATLLEYINNKMQTLKT